MLERLPMKRSPGSRRERDHLFRTVCQECGVGCGILASVRDGRIVDVQGDEEHPVSRGRLCARGTAFVQGLGAAERLTSPAVRRTRGGALEPHDDWRTAVDALAERLRQVRERHGPESLLVCGEADAGLDFHLGALRFAQLWGPAQVAVPGGPAREPWPDGLQSATGPFTDWIHAGSILLVEADLAATHPVAFARVQEARRRGALVIAADARLTRTLAHADVVLRTRAGRGNLLGLALAKLALSERPVHGAPAAEARWRSALEQLSLEGAEHALGAPLEGVRGAARALAGRGPACLITGRELAGLDHHRVWLALAVAMGWVGARGGGWHPVGAGPPPLAIHGDGAEPGEPRAEVVPVALDEALDRGGVRAVLCAGDALAERAAWPEEIELVAHFGAYPCASRDRAAFSFPAALWPEREGSFFGDDRAVAWAPRIVAPPAGCRSGLDLWIELARRFGWERRFPWVDEDGRADAAAFHGWVLARSPATGGLGVDALRALPPGGAAWPTGEAPHLALARARSLAPPPVPPSLAEAAAVPAEPGRPLALAAVRSAVRSGEASRHWSWTRGLERDDAVQLDPETALRLGIENGDEVLVETGRGEWPGRAQVTRAVARGTLGAARGALGAGALVRRKGQSPDEARALLGGLP